MTTEAEQIVSLKDKQEEALNLALFTLEYARSKFIADNRVVAAQACLRAISSIKEALA